MGVLALSTPATIALIAGVLVALAFVGGLVALALRRGPSRGPDIPPGMRPGPSDEVLERRYLEKVMVWGVMFTLLFALWLPVLWLREPEQNVDDEIDLVSRSVHRGSLWFQVADEENPTGFGCERCHGPKGVGGQTIIFNTPEGEQVEVQPPSLNNVCSRLPIEGTGGIRETIMQGRPGTPMPSWSVRFAGPMNDQQIQDLVSYVVELNEKTIGAGKDNLCLNPPAEGETTTTASPTPGASPTGGATPSPAPTTPGSP